MRRCHKIDLLAKQAAQHFVHVSDDSVEIQHAGLKDLFAAEGQELARQRSRAGGSLLDLFCVQVEAFGGRKLFQEQVGVANDSGEDVVEIVGDAAGELANGLDLLRLKKLFF